MPLTEDAITGKVLLSSFSITFMGNKKEVTMQSIHEALILAGFSVVPVVPIAHGQTVLILKKSPVKQEDKGATMSPDEMKIRKLHKRFEGEIPNSAVDANLIPQTEMFAQGYTLNTNSQVWTRKELKS